MSNTITITITITAGSTSITDPAGYADTIVINGVTVTPGGAEDTTPAVDPAPLPSAVYTSEMHGQRQMLSAAEVGDTLFFVYRKSNGEGIKRTLYITKVASEYFGGAVPEGGFKRFNIKDILEIHRLEKGVQSF